MCVSKTALEITTYFLDWAALRPIILYSLQINNANTLTFTRARSGDRLNCAAAVTAILFWGELSREDEGLRHPGAFLWRQAG